VNTKLLPKLKYKLFLEFRSQEHSDFPLALRMKKEFLTSISLVMS
jgi:hypothetical protein